MVAIVLGTTAAPAHAAASLAEVRAALTKNPVFIDPQAEAAQLVDAGRVRAAIGAAPIVVAVLPAADGTQAGSCSDLPREIDGPRTVFVLCGYRPAAGSSLLRQGAAANIVSRLATPQRTREGYTAAIETFISQAKRAPRAGTSSRPMGPSEQSQAGPGAGPWIAGGIGLAVVGGGIGYAVRRRRRKTADVYAAARAELDVLKSRLANDVNTVNPGDDPAARQAMADASERYLTAGSMLARARTMGELAAARDAVVEGLYAARAARQRLGMDPGPPIPQTRDSDQLQAPQQVQVGGQTYQGFPSYLPGASNYFPGGMVGGAYVPGGWYRDRFWEGALLGGLAGTVLTGGLGGFGGFGGFGYGSGYGTGYESGYDTGYERGLERGEDNVETSGGDWNAGGDWSSGSGDWSSGNDWGSDSGGGADGDFGGGDSW